MEVPEPVRTPVRDFVRLVRRTLEELGKDDFAGIAAQMTYYFMLGLFPMLILLVGFLDALPLARDTGLIVEDLTSGLPDGIAVLLGDYLRDFAARKPSSGLLVWVLVALWAASRAMSGARKGLDRVFRAAPHGPHPLVKRLWDLVLTFGGVATLCAGYMLMIGGRRLLLGIGKLFGASGAPGSRCRGW